ncbi:hypothetical protein QNA17_04630 [Rhodococcus pyridinivorans]|uniref:hypothetical protein n=1 Tax=Rhodococcus pyridinivorans TaxID=103816 RepID=UPI0024BBAC38|nr:hypothetical protein [Rhodococcus pyridinivorans]MDJ0481053.1 hypothetical protein [Rhodococcus pyridinivorans]
MRVEHVQCIAPIHEDVAVVDSEYARDRWEGTETRTVVEADQSGRARWSTLGEKHMDAGREESASCITGDRFDGDFVVDDIDLHEPLRGTSNHCQRPGVRSPLHRFVAAMDVVVVAEISGGGIEHGENPVFVCPLRELKGDAAAVRRRRHRQDVRVRFEDRLLRSGDVDSACASAGQAAEYEPRVGCAGAAVLFPTCERGIESIVDRERG